jgi:hypothetical protein
MPQSCHMNIQESSHITPPRLPLVHSPQIADKGHEQLHPSVSLLLHHHCCPPLHPLGHHRMCICQVLIHQAKTASKRPMCLSPGTPFTRGYQTALFIEVPWPPLKIGFWELCSFPT